MQTKHSIHPMHWMTNTGYAYIRCATRPTPRPGARPSNVVMDQAASNATRKTTVTFTAPYLRVPGSMAAGIDNSTVGDGFQHYVRGQEQPPPNAAKCSVTNTSMCVCTASHVEIEDTAKTIREETCRITMASVLHPNHRYIPTSLFMSLLQYCGWK